MYDRDNVNQPPIKVSGILLNGNSFFNFNILHLIHNEFFNLLFTNLILIKVSKKKNKNIAISSLKVIYDVSTSS